MIIPTVQPLFGWNFISDYAKDSRTQTRAHMVCSSFEPEMIGYKEHDWFFTKEKNNFLSIINSYPQGFLLYCVILLSGVMQGIYVLDALHLLPLTHKKTKTNRPLLRDRQTDREWWWLDPRSSLLASFVVNKSNACQFSCVTSAFYAHKIHGRTRLPLKFTFTHEICQVMFRGE